MEFFLLSTCNRTEIYYWNDREKKEEFIHLISRFKNNPSLKNNPHIFRSVRSTPLAVKRLFNVSNGVLSQVLGDLQIIGQVKNAYRLASELDCTGTHLHKLLQSVFSSYKEVATNTKFHAGSASVSYAAMELVREFLKKNRTKSILVVGAGNFSKEVLSELQKRGLTNITITNRTIEKARELADNYHIKTISFEELDDTWCFDVVISCIQGGNYIINESMFEINSPATKLLIDLSVPRSIDPSLGLKKGIRLVNIGHIRDKNNEALAMRKNALDDVNSIIDTYCAEYIAFLETNKARPVINQLKKTLTEIGHKELNKHSKKLNKSEVSIHLVETITHNIINKIIRKPARQLNSCSAGIDQLSEALTMLFELNTNENMPIRKD